MIFKDRKLVFIHIPKTAGTVIEKILIYNLHNREEFENWHNTPQPKRAVGGITMETKQHTTMCQIRMHLEYVQKENYKGFSIVRNPWDRLCSYYFYKANFKNYIREIPFTDWIADLGNSDEGLSRWDRKIFYGSQVCWWTNDESNDITNIADNFTIFRFEDITTKRVDEFCELTGFDDDKLPLSNRGIIINIPYREFYDEYSRDLVADICKPEIEHFDYEF